MAAPPFVGRIPVAAGDDFTDEDAFKAVQDLGGFAVLVGEPRQTAARHRLGDTKAVMTWLRAGLSA
jgi:trehalose 6-phosphate phosphatase